MLKFNEDLLHFIWQHRLLKPKTLYTTSGKEIRVLKTGQLNADAGPDFFNAQIALNDLVLAGNVEVHIHTSDWLKHNHQFDRSYDHLILHVVYEHDAELPQNVNNQVEVLELKDLITDETLAHYHELAAACGKLPCERHLSGIEDLVFGAWMERMCIERLESKVRTIELIFNGCGNDYTQTFFILLLRNFGFKVNALPFELLAKHISVQLLLKHSDNLFQLEALLLGMAGFLDDQYKTRYIQQLQNEFEFLKQKYALIPLKTELFKFSKLRPANFPNLRLVQFAMLLHKNRNMFLNPQATTIYADLYKQLKISQTGYWKNHFTIDGSDQNKSLGLGDSSIENVMINTFAPYFFFYGRKLLKPEYSDYAIDLLNRCECENNGKTRLFWTKKHMLQSAALSQGLINLFDNYCTHKKCLQCGIGAGILRSRKISFM